MTTQTKHAGIRQHTHFNLHRIRFADWNCRETPEEAKTGGVAGGGGVLPLALTLVSFALPRADCAPNQPQTPCRCSGWTLSSGAWACGSFCFCRSRYKGTTYNSQHNHTHTHLTRDHPHHHCTLARGSKDTLASAQSMARKHTGARTEPRHAT